MDAQAILKDVRVVLLNQYYAPDSAATAQILADLGAGLAAAGHDVVAVCSNRAYADPQQRYVLRETIDGVSVRRTRTSGFGRARHLGRTSHEFGQGQPAPVL